MTRISKEERALHDRLRAAHERNLIEVYTDFKRLNAASSPVFNPWEAVGPLLLLLMLSLFILLVGGLIAGTVALILSVLLFIVGIRPWLELRVRHRAIVFLIRDVQTMQILWAYGGVGMSLADQPHTVCVAPEGNWRNFVRRHLPDAARESLDQELAGSGFTPQNLSEEGTEDGAGGMPDIDRRA